MSSITTFTGKQFDPCFPDENAICIQDIAHALSLICRAGGHFPIFYSVGQHCICCAREAKERGYSLQVQLECLLHDASEAYIADITRPVKQHLTDYLEYERVLQNAIYKKFLGHIPSKSEQEQISAVDDCMLYHEFLTLMGKKLFEHEPKMLSKPEFKFQGFESVENEYLSLFEQLYSKSLQQ